MDGNGNGEVKAMEGLEMEGPGIGGEDGGGNGEPEIL